jgi:hypothetical protein
MATVRPRLDWFVDRMRAKLALAENQVKGEWRDEDDPEDARKWLWSRIGQEMKELQGALWGPNAHHFDAIDECADVANMLMMLADLEHWGAS